MKLLSKYKREITGFVILSLFYFFLRLVFLTSLPIFTDEAIYLRWAQIALRDSSWRFISLTDGKQPMFVWVAMIFIKFINDPLVAGRLVSVLTGFVTMLGLFVLTYELFKNKTTAFLASLLYIFYPFAQVLDRMAIYDSMVATFYVWGLYFSILLVRKLRLDVSYTLGFVIGAGVLTKSSNFFSLYLLPFLLVIFDFKQKGMWNKLLRYIVLAGFSSAIAYGLYSILRLSPLYSMIDAKDATFVYPVSQWITHPFTYLFSNLSGLTSWLLQYLTFSYIVLILIAVFFIGRFFREKLLLIIFFLLPFLALALFGRLIYPRFIFLMSLMLLPLAAWGLEYLISFVEKRLKLGLPKLAYLIVLTLIFVAYPGFISLQYANDPTHSHIADRDKSQYIDGWAAGWGVKESVAFFRQQAQNHKIFIATEGTFGLMPESMELYLVQNKNITIKGYWPVDVFPKEVSAMAKIMPTYFIFYQPQHRILPAGYPTLKLIFEVKQGNTNDYYRVYQVTK